MRFARRMAVWRFLSAMWRCAVTGGSVLVLTACQGAATRPQITPNLQNDPPESLSEWRLFDVDARTLAPRSDGIVYELNTPLFSDYAHKLRSIHLPQGTSMRSDDDAIELPVGTIVTKTFYYDLADPGRRDGAIKKNPSREATSIDLHRARLIETRLLVRTSNGWIALPYVWNDSQTDATLALAGESIELELIDLGRTESFIYEVPDANQCAGCHVLDQSAQRIEPIGIKARHLDRDGHDGTNQLASWTRAGRLEGSGTQRSIARNARWDDPAQNLNSRARAYLDVNCGHCHSATGPANTSGLFLDAGETDATKLGVCKLPVATGRGSASGTFDIVPGRPRESILLLRMMSTEPDIAMPEFGRSLVHEEGIALIHDWIESLPDRCE